MISECAKMNDRELVTIIQTSTERNLVEKASETIFRRYERQIHKNWLRLEAQLDHSGIVHALKEDYYDEAYEAFIVAIRKVDLNRIENDNWKLVGMVNWYLTNVRTKLIKIALKNSKIKAINSMTAANNGDDCMIADPDVEEAYWIQEGYKNEPSIRCELNEQEDNCKRAVVYCKSKWTPEENNVYELLLEGLDKAEIARSLGIKLNKIYGMVNKMKSDMKKYLYA